jgi:hypothetical protein
VIENELDPVPVTLVATLTPGPLRWKLWFEALSLTVSVCAPAGSVPLGPEIVNPGPTDPL